MSKIEGDLNVQGKVGIVEQEPYIMMGTLKENILMGTPYDREFFNQIIKICCLEQDITGLPNGIESAIGEKGINLSGG